MSKNFPHDNIYSILGKLDALKPTPAEERFALVKEIRESVEAQGSVLEGVSAVEAKLARQFAESDFSKMSAAIQKTGKSKASADAITAAAGREKLGQKEMTRRSVAGRKDESYNPVKAVKQCAKDYMEMNGIHSVHNLEAEDIESIGGDCQMNYRDVCEILGCNLPDSLGPVKSWDTDEHGNKFDLEEATCNECGMYESECSCDHTNEGIVDNIKFAFGKTIAWVVDTAAKFANTPELKGKMNQAKVDLANKAEQQMLKAIAGHPREDQLKQQVNYIVTQLKQQPTMGDLLNVAKQLGAEFKTERSKFEEGEITRKPGVTKHTKTDYPGYPTDDTEDSLANLSGPGAGRKGRPRKAQTKNPRPVVGAEKKGRGRPSKAPTVKSPTMPHDPFGRVSSIPKGTPGKVHTMSESIMESVNFKRMMEEQHMTLEEMLECMNADMMQFKESGVCSDRLRDMLEVYSHAKRQMEETQQPAPVVPRGIPGNVPVPGKMDRLNQRGPDYMEETDPLEEELSKLAELAGITMGEAQLNKKPDADSDGIPDWADKNPTVAGDDEDRKDEEVEQEGNAFGKAVRDAKADGIQPGEKVNVGGREYAVREAQELVAMLRVAGLDTKQLEEALAKNKATYGNTEVDGEDDADEELANAPDEECMSMKASTLNPGEADSGEKQMNPDRPTFKNGDNALSKPPVREATIKLEDRLAAEYESIKKVS